MGDQRNVAAATPRKLDQYGRAIFGDTELPDPYSPDSRFAQWRGKTCGPWQIIDLGRSEERHKLYCFRGWTNNGDWWYVCRRCHPDAVDMPATSNHQTSTSGAPGGTTA
jgi:hypothetical protein